MTDIGDMTTKIEVDLASNGTGTLKIGGHDISSVVAGFQVVVEAGKTTRVLVDLRGDVQLTAEAAAFLGKLK